MTDEYTDSLSKKFKSFQIELVDFDNGATPQSMAAYVLISGFTKNDLKDKGGLVLDLGNFIYRKYRIIYEHTPEFSRKGESKNSLAFYISKEKMGRMPHVQEWLLKNYNSDSDEPVKRWESALYRGHRFVIQKDIE